MSLKTFDTSVSSGLSVRGLAVAYGDLRAVDGVDLDVSVGEVVALLGASGSGKSSLLRAVAGLEDVAGGEVTWGGRDMVRVPVHKRGFGLMFQDGQLFEHRDVGGNIAYGLRGLPRSRRLERVREVLDLVGLPGFERRRVTTLSGGQAQRVALARALAPAPRLLLLDEPLSALDRALREQLATDVRTILRQGGTTALYVTHDQDEAMTVADRVGVMEAGRLLRLDTPQQLWADPGSRSVARFLGFDVIGDLALAPGALRVVGGADEEPEGQRGVRVEECHSRRPFTAVGDEEPHDSNPVAQQTGADTEVVEAAEVRVSLRDTLGDSTPGQEGEFQIAAKTSESDEFYEVGVTSRPEGERAQAPTDAEASVEAAAFADLSATVLASRLRRGQWEAEVALDPEQLAGPAGPTTPARWAEPTGSDGSVGQADQGADPQGGTGSEPGGRRVGESEPMKQAGAAPSVGDDSGDCDDRPFRATVLAQRPHTPGEHVALCLDPSRTARLQALEPDAQDPRGSRPGRTAPHDPTPRSAPTRRAAPGLAGLRTGVRRAARSRS